MTASKNFFFFFTLFCVLCFPLSQGEACVMRPEKINLPDTINGWRLGGEPKRIEKTTIFDYMNGAGELYLSYHFDHLSIYEYKNKSGNDIVVELYAMKDSQDAFGLLSLDWGGEPVDLRQPEEGKSKKAIIPQNRALYGKGLLRVWSDNLFIRIMAFKDMPGVKEVILRLGEIITTGRGHPSPPEMLHSVKLSPDSPWTLRKDRTAYFRSYLVLNSLFYISHENILNLDLSTEAVIVTYEREQETREKQTARLVVIKYPDQERAATALDSFFKAYLPDQKSKVTPDRERESQDFFPIEDGWMGFKLRGRGLALVFECPDKQSAQEMIEQALLDLFSN